MSRFMRKEALPSPDPDEAIHAVAHVLALT